MLAQPQGVISIVHPHVHARAPQVPIAPGRPPGALGLVLERSRLLCLSLHAHDPPVPPFPQPCTQVCAGEATCMHVMIAIAACCHGLFS